MLEVANLCLDESDTKVVLFIDDGGAGQGDGVVMMTWLVLGLFEAS